MKSVPGTEMLDLVRAGIDTYQEFIERHQKAMEKGDPD